jgi:hypothetical protein
LGLYINHGQKVLENGILQRKMLLLEWERAKKNAAACPAATKASKNQNNRTTFALQPEAA